MKVIYPRYILSLFSILLLICSCEDKNDSVDKNISQEALDNQYVNNWVYMKMDTFYLWRDKMPAKNSLDLSRDPLYFFDLLLYKKDQRDGDRFSWIENNYSGSTTTKATSTTSDLGFEYATVQFVDSQGKPTGLYGFLIIYVKPLTNAQNIGLRRGQLIETVDDKPITKDNWFSALLQNKNSYKLTFLDFEGSKPQEKELTVTKTAGYTEDPILLDSIYNLSPSKKAGYIVFNSFGTEIVENQLQNDKKLLSTLSKFADQGVTDLILDLRYNGGGLVSSAIYLGSAIVPNRQTSMVFEKKTYNNMLQPIFDRNPRLYNDWLYDYFADKMEDGTEIPKLGGQFKNLYVIATQFTASSSELIINGLRPYRTVTHIGENTVGKNQGSFAIYEKNVERNKWKIQPIVFKTENSLGESNYGGVGFTPDIAGSDFGNLLDYGTAIKQLGDKDETLLNIALTKIAGGLPKSTKSKMQNPPYKIASGSSLERKSNNGKMLVNKDNLEPITN